jgi:hypothetical protein
MESKHRLLARKNWSIELVKKRDSSCTLKLLRSFAILVFAAVLLAAQDRNAAIRFLSRFSS